VLNSTHRYCTDTGKFVRVSFLQDSNSKINLIAHLLDVGCYKTSVFFILLLTGKICVVFFQFSKKKPVSKFLYMRKRSEYFN